MSSQCCTGAGRARHVLGCLACGTSCCAACAIDLESVPYCPSCARSLLETPIVRASAPFVIY